MTKQEINAYLVKHCPNTEIKFIGAGSDSYAFCVGEYVYRFPRYDVVLSQYEKEARLCNFLRDATSVLIPNIEIQYKPISFAKHKMILGNKWHWHSLALFPIKQMRLARSIARFFAEIHTVNISKFKLESERVDYVEFNELSKMIAPFLSKRQLNFFKKKYNKIINRRIPKNDMVMCHMGFKGQNSVIDNKGNLVGVFDFGNAGIHERWRDLSVVRKGGNKWLYRQVVRHYEKLTGIKCDRARIADLGSIEHFIYKRWFHEDGTPRLSDTRIKTYLSRTLVCFYHLPTCCTSILYAWMTVRHAFIKSN